MTKSAALCKIINTIMYRITIHRIDHEKTPREAHPDLPEYVNVDTDVYSQVFLELDVEATIALLNKRPRVRGTRKKREGAK